MRKTLMLLLLLPFAALNSGCQNGSGAKEESSASPAVSTVGSPAPSPTVAAEVVALQNDVTKLQTDFKNLADTAARKNDVAVLQGRLDRLTAKLKRSEQIDDQIAAKNQRIELVAEEIAAKRTEQGKIQAQIDDKRTTPDQKRFLRIQLNAMTQMLEALEREKSTLVNERENLERERSGIRQSSN